mgnify:CR=1 FL=1
MELKINEKRVTDHKMKLEGTLVLDNGVLLLVQKNDFDEVVRYKALDEALVNFLDKDVKLTVVEAEKDEEEVEHEVEYND